MPDPEAVQRATHSAVVELVRAEPWRRKGNPVSSYAVRTNPSLQEVVARRQRLKEHLQGAWQAQDAGPADDSPMAKRDPQRKIADIHGVAVYLSGTQLVMVHEEAQHRRLRRNHLTNLLRRSGRLPRKGA